MLKNVFTAVIIAILAVVVVVVSLSSAAVGASPAMGVISLAFASMIGVSFYQELTKETDALVKRLLSNESVWDENCSTESLEMLKRFFCQITPMVEVADRDTILVALRATAYDAGYNLRSYLLDMTRYLDNQQKIPVFLGRDGDLLLKAYRKLNGKHSAAFLAEGLQRNASDEAYTSIISFLGLRANSHILVDTGYSGSIFTRISNLTGESFDGVLVSKSASAPRKYYGCKGENARDAVIKVEHAPRPSGYMDQGIVYYPRSTYPEKWELWDAYVQAFLEGLIKKKAPRRLYYRTCWGCGHEFLFTDLNAWGLCDSCNIRITGHPDLCCSRCQEAIEKPDFKTAWTRNDTDDTMRFSIKAMCDDCYEWHTTKCRKCNASVRRSDAINGMCPRCAYDDEGFDDIHVHGDYPFEWVFPIGVDAVVSALADAAFGVEVSEGVDRVYAAMQMLSIVTYVGKTAMRYHQSEQRLYWWNGRLDWWNENNFTNYLMSRVGWELKQYVAEALGVLTDIGNSRYDFASGDVRYYQNNVINQANWWADGVEHFVNHIAEEPEAWRTFFWQGRDTLNSISALADILMRYKGMSLEEYLVFKDQEGSDPDPDRDENGYELDDYDDEMEEDEDDEEEEAEVDENGFSLVSVTIEDDEEDEDFVISPSILEKIKNGGKLSHTTDDLPL